MSTHLGHFGFLDFYVPLEHLWVHEAEVERRGGHGRGDSDRVEDGLVSEEAEEEVVEHVAHGVDYHHALGPCSTA